MDDEQKVMTMKIVLRAEEIRAEEIRKKHIDRGCQVCCDREQFNDENDEKEVNYGK